jgi:EmrB/QacA subfamily drug resistance transporter
MTDKANNSAKTSLRDRSPILAGLMLTMGLSAMDSTIVATAIPSLVRDLSGFALFPWVFSAYLLTSTVANPIYGKLADMYGRKLLLLGGISIFLLGSVLCGLAWNMLALIVFRGIQGIGAGSIQTLTSTVVGDIYTIEERGRIQGWLSSVWGISSVIGPAIGGLFVQFSSWRWIFYINLPIGLAAMLMIATRLHEKNVSRKRQIDFGGAVLLVVGAGLLIFGLLQGGVSWDWLAPQSIVIFVVAIVALVVFAWHEGRTAEPIIPPWIFGSRLLIGVNLTSAVVGLLTIGLTTFLPTFAQRVLGADPVSAGFALAAMSIGWPLASSFSSRLYLKIGFRNTALAGSGIALIASLFLGLLPETSSTLLIAVGSFLMGAGLGLIATSLLVGVQSVVGWTQRGVVTAATMFMRALGSTIGAALFGSISNSILANWLRQAPATLKGELPSSVNELSNTAVSNQSGTQAASYLRDGLYTATNAVFWGLVVAALFGLALVLITPQKFTALHSNATEPETVKQPEEGQRVG